MSHGVKKFLGINLMMVVILGAFIGVSLLSMAASRAHAAEGESAAAATAKPGAPAPSAEGRGMAFLAAALAVSVACIAAGIAVGMTGSAAIGAVAERPEIMARTLIFVGLAEGIAIYGLIVALMILNKV